MGGTLNASCPCGFEPGLIDVGGGMLNMMTYCGAPALCRKCQTLVVVNYFDEMPKCPTCSDAVTCYNDPALQDASRTSQRDVFTWTLDDNREFTLPETKYLCHKCGQKEMTFAEGGIAWD